MGGGPALFLQSSGCPVIQGADFCVCVCVCVCVCFDVVYILNCVGKKMPRKVVLIYNYHSLYVILSIINQCLI